LLGLEAFYFQDDFHLLPIVAAPAGEIVRPILVSRALPFVGDGEVEVVIACISDHLRHLLKLIRHAVLPLGRVEDNMAYMALGRADTGSHGTEEYGVDQVQRDKLFLRHRHLRPACPGLGVITRGPAPLPEHRLAFLVSPVARRFFKRRINDGVVNEKRHGFVTYTAG